MLLERLIAADAVERIKAASNAGNRILGVDGFRIVPEGFVAALDLILDLSLQPMSPVDAADAAITFVTLHAEHDVVFEVVIDDDPFGS